MQPYTSDAQYVGLTWDHPRGYDALAYTATTASSGTPGVPLIHWKKHTLRGFESAPLRELASKYDLLVIDHPHVGTAVTNNSILPLESLFSEQQIVRWTAQPVGRAMESYLWQGKHWALPIDVACQVMVYRDDLIAFDGPLSWNDVLKLSEQGKVAMSVSGPHLLMAFFALCLSLGEEPGGSELIGNAVGSEACGMLSRLMARSPRGTSDLDPIRLSELMRTTDDVPLVPLVYGYVNYSRPVSGKRRLTFTDVPSLEGRYGSVLGGTGLAVTGRTKPSPSLLRYIEFLMSPEAQAGVIPSHEGQPAARAAWTSDKVNNESGNFYRNTLLTTERAWVRPRFDGYVRFQDAGSEVLKGAIAADDPPQRAIEKLRACWRTFAHSLT